MPSPSPATEMSVHGNPAVTTDNSAGQPAHFNPNGDAPMPQNK
jgi:hypothetical protein